MWKRKSNIYYNSLFLGKGELGTDNAPLYKMSFNIAGQQLLVSNCDTCGYCCQANIEDPSLELTKHDELNFRNKRIQVRLVSSGHMEYGNADQMCQNLQPTGCRLLDDKPTICKWWPLLVYANQIVFDTACPSIKTHTLFELRQIATESIEALLALGTDALYVMSKEAQRHDTSKNLIYTGVYLDKVPTSKTYPTTSPTNSQLYWDSKKIKFVGSSATTLYPLTLNGVNLAFLTNSIRVCNTPLHVLADLALVAHEALIQSKTTVLKMLHTDYKDLADMITTDVKLDTRWP